MKFRSEAIEEHVEVPVADGGAWEDVIAEFESRHRSAAQRSADDGERVYVVCMAVGRVASVSFGQREEILSLVSAQGSQGRAARIRADRTAQERAKGVLLRRSLHVDLALSAVLPVLSEVSQTVIDLEDVALYRGGTRLFEGLDLQMGRQRVAITGRNGAGKTSLFEVAVGDRRPSSGRAFVDRSRIGVVAQGAENWKSDDSLLSLLLAQSSVRSAEELATVLGAHRFPLGLAERPFHSLSPGERTRAALIALCYRPRHVEVLALDEPTGSLDFLGIDSLTASLRAWRGGLLVVSHDEEFLQNIGMDRYLPLRRQPNVMATERQVHQKEKS